MLVNSIQFQGLIRFLILRQNLNFSGENKILFINLHFLNKFLNIGIFKIEII